MQYGNNCPDIWTRDSFQILFSMNLWLVEKVKKQVVITELTKGQGRQKEEGREHEAGGMKQAWS